MKKWLEKLPVVHGVIETASSQTLQKGDGPDEYCHGLPDNGMWAYWTFKCPYCNRTGLVIIEETYKPYLSGVIVSCEQDRYSDKTYHDYHGTPYDNERITRLRRLRYFEVTDCSPIGLAARRYKKNEWLHKL